MKISDLNIERCLFLLHERNDVLWLTIADSCGLDVVSYVTAGILFQILRPMRIY